MLSSDDDDGPREQKIDGTKLPNFEAIRRYLGPAGLCAVREDDGWYLFGITYNRNAP